MNRTIRKIIRRGLLRTPGRFIAVFLITVLGAGFLAGLQSASPSMAGTANNYFSQQGLADLWIYCDKGISAEDVEEVQALPEVAEASGGYSVDLVAYANSAASLFSIRSLPQDTTQATTGYLTQLDLVEGRLPESATEGVADPLSNLQVGDTVTVSENNREGSLDLLSRRSFTIVGLAWSPHYISSERGSSSSGTGRVGQYLYVLEAAFSSDWYTELVVRLTTTEPHSAFSAAYAQAIESATQTVQDLMASRADQRLDGILNEASDELNEAEASFEKEKTKVLSELEAAKKELDDGWDALREAQEEYARQEEFLSDLRAELEQAQRDLEAASAELSAQSNAPEDGNAELAAALAMYNALQAEYAVADLARQEELALQISALNVQIATLRGQIAKGEAEIASGQDAMTAYTAAEAAIATGNQQLAEGTSALAEAANQISQSTDTLTSATADYDAQFELANQELADARAELDAAWRDFQAAEQPQWIIQDRDDLPGYSGFSADMDRINSLSLVLPWFFFLVAVIVCLTTMTRMVEEHRRQIGTLKANGYRRWQMTAIYQSYAWVIGLTGGGVGVVLGLLVFPSAIWNSYSTQYHIGSFQTVITLAPCAIGFLGSALALSLVTSIACRNSLHKNAADLMRPRSPRSGKRVLLERVTFLWRRLSFSHKTTIRNLLRYKVRFAVTVIGVVGCTALLVAALGLRDSISGIVDLQYGEISKTQATLVLDSPSRASDNTELNRLLTGNNIAFSYAYSEGIVVTHDDRTNANITTYLLVPEDLEGFANLMNFRQRLDQTPIAFPLDESTEPAVIMTEQVATALGVRVGDLVDFGLSDEQTTQVKVGAITENYVYNYLYLTPASYETLTGEPAAYNTVVIRSDLEGDQFDALLTDLVATDHVATALPVAQLKTLMDLVITNLSAVIWLMVFSALALAVIVIYNLITINVTERERELATLRVLGYHRREVAGYIARESSAMALFGIPLGLLAGLVLHAYVMGVLVASDIMFPRVVKPLSLVSAAVIPLLCTVLVNVCIRPRLNRLNPATSLKSVE